MKKDSILIICSRGGHITEMMEFVEAFEGYALTLVTYSEKYDMDLTRFNKKYFMLNPFQNIWRSFDFIYKNIVVMLKERPKFVFSTGSEIAILPFYFFKYFCGSKLIYIESGTRIFKPSLTGKIVYPICDLFLVQWDILREECGKKAQYVGGLI